MSIEQVLVVAAFIEALVQTVKPIYDAEQGWNKDVITALVVSLVVCVVFGVDFFAAVGIPAVVPYAGSVLSGILLSRGAAVIHELIGATGALKATLLRR